MPPASPVVDLPGITLPVFPKFQEVVYHFYQNYKGSAEPYFKLSKHPDGYRITRLNDNNLPMFEPELIWSAQKGWQPVINFDKPEPVEPDAMPRVAAVYDPYERKETAALVPAPPYCRTSGMRPAALLEARRQLY